MAELREFLAALATDPAKLGDFIRDPDSAMAAADLAPEDQSALKSGTTGAIYARLTGAAPLVVAPTIVLIVDMMPAEAQGEDMPVIRPLQPLQFPLLQFPPPQLPPPQFPLLQFPPPQVPPQFPLLQFPPPQLPPPQFPLLQFPPPQVPPQFPLLQFPPQVAPLQSPQQVQAVANIPSPPLQFPLLQFPPPQAPPLQFPLLQFPPPLQIHPPPLVFPQVAPLFWR